MKRESTYTGANIREISFPLGGIGTGSIGLSGNGGLIDWEIRNHPAKFTTNGFSFFAVKATRDGEVLTTRVVQADLAAPYSGTGSGRFEGYGFGPKRGLMAGLPHFRSCEFRGEFPVASVQFDDPASPVAVQLTAFNPFIPLNDADSSIPAALLTYRVTNVTSEELEVSLAGCVSNPFAAGSVNSAFSSVGVTGVSLSTVAEGPGSPSYGELAIATDGDDVAVQEYWYRGEWFDNITVFWREFSSPHRLPARTYAEPRDLDQYRVVEQNFDTAALEVHRPLAPGETADFRFVLTWHFPNVTNDWNPLPEGSGLEPVWRNYYATRFESAASTAEHVLSRWDELLHDTQQFHDALYGSTLPADVLEAVGANLSTLKSPTVMRLTDGTLYGFEGCHTDEGSCEGSCTHVWNYEQVTDFLFPSLARSMRELDYRVNQLPSGEMAFRTMLPLGRERFDYHPAVDGQFGSIIRAYRQWRLSGDRGWLASLWPSIKRALEFAWSEANPDGWDRDKDGVLEGAQHHTLDVELYGPNPFLNGYYQAALLAASHMAEALDDPSAELYLRLYEAGRAWIDEHAFNGEYYFQPVDLADPAYPVSAELGQIKYQIGAGCHIDQLVGQWHADVSGLGDVFDRGQVRTALRSIYHHNFTSMRDHVNTNRVYALNDEKGVLVCTWPRGGQPVVPVPYASECWTGLEYAFASSLLFAGFVEEGLSVVAAVRDRFDGERRNPWNEFECGSHYVRAMSSYSLLLAMSGFRFDAVSGDLHLSPLTDGSDFTSVWASGGAWGTLGATPKRLTVQVLGGVPIRIRRLHSALLPEGEADLEVGERRWRLPIVGGTLTLPEDAPVLLSDQLTVSFE